MYGKTEQMSARDDRADRPVWKMRALDLLRRQPPRVGDTKAGVFDSAPARTWFAVDQAQRSCPDSQRAFATAEPKPERG